MGRSHRRRHPIEEKRKRRQVLSKFLLVNRNDFDTSFLVAFQCAHLADSKALIQVRRTVDTADARTHLTRIRTAALAAVKSISVNADREEKEEE